MKPLFIIPARGGSKGIPGKNIKALAGKPLLAWTADVALELAQDSTHILLSTDSEEIAAVGASCGIPTEYRRPAEFATDTASSRSFILDAMKWARQQGIEFDSIVLLQPTSPFRTADDVRRALDLYYNIHPDADMVVSVCQAAANPYYNLFETSGEDGTLHVCKGDGLFTRRQDCPTVWEYNGAVYVIRPESLEKMELGAFPRRYPCPMPRERSLDLDTPEDWLRAEEAAKNLLVK